MFKNIFGFGLVALMLMACFAGIASAEVSYAKTYMDPSGDVEPEQNDDADILEMKSTPSGDNILFTMKFKGTARSNATYSITLNVDGEEGMILHSMGMTMYTAPNITDFIDLTVSGNTATFTVPKSDFNAKTLFDISSAYVVDAESSNMDTITCGAAPADDDDDTTTDDDTLSDDDDDDNATDDDTNTTGGESKKKTPGFEFIFALSAAAVVGIVFWIRRK